MVDYKDLGLKVGLELHQQLDTKHKLFCNCPTRIRDDPPDVVFVRRLRPTQSELGQVDEAALFEFKRGKTYVYEAYNDSTCLVEQDEEPPHDINREAVEIALIASLLLKAEPVDVVHVMRKVVIDGSNTTGFQRTAMVALGGPKSKLEDPDGDVGVQTVCVEEDAARKISESASEVRYRLDRLGIPLIEVTTAPDIWNPDQAERVALKIGQILRATGRVKRGLGTIRQDLNVSIERGARIEIKGVQDLELISRVIELEVQRQLKLLEITEELRRRGVKEEDVKDEFIDITELFQATKSKLIKGKLEMGYRVMALRLPGFAGLLGVELQPNRRLGTEFKDYACFWGSVEGIFHTDELPAYGISSDEVQRLKEEVKAGTSDAVVFTVAPQVNAIEALKAVARRAREALRGVPEETRSVNPDGTTHYTRPRPGSARMYPETDVRPLTIPKEYIEKLRSNLPELPERKLKRFIEELGLSQELATLMVSSYRLDLFERVLKECNVPPSLVATTIEQTWRSLKRDGLPMELISEETIVEMFKLVEKGVIVKEAVPEVLAWLAKNPSKSVEEAVEALGIKAIPLSEVERIIDEVLKVKEPLIKERGVRAEKAIMGEVMKVLRGKVDGKRVSELVSRKLREALSRV